MKNLFRLIFLLAFLSPADLFAQASRFGAWAALFHTQRFGERWGASFDGQFRFTNSSLQLQNILLRPSINYYFKGNTVAALGYAYVTTNGQDAAGTHTFRPESRIWEQLIFNSKIGTSSTLQHRFRLEQRFLGNTTGLNDRYFAQRLRYFARAVIPFHADSSFVKGPFLGLQNEMFLNVVNKDKVNRHFFDQNRAYIAFGYRLSKKVDLELGYLNQYIKRPDSYLINHVVQTAVYTRF